MDKRQRRLLRKNSVLGGFLLIVLAAMTFLTFRLSGMTFEKRVDWPVYFGPDSILRKGYEVFVSGTKVGRVKSVQLLGEDEIAKGRHVRAVLTLTGDLVLWQGAEVVVSPRSVLGGFVIVVRRGDPGTPPLEPGTPLTGRVDRGVLGKLDDLVARNSDALASMSGDLAVVAGRLRRGEGSMGRFLADDEIYENVRAASAALARVAGDLDSDRTTIGRLLRDRTMYDDLTSLLHDLRAITSGALEGKGVLGRLVADEEAGERLAGTLASLQQVAGRLERGEGTLGLLLRDEGLYRDLRAGVATLRRFTERMEKGEGSLSRLLTDDEVYENLRVLSANLRLVSEDVAAGKGTLGLLLRDEGVYNELRRMLESFRESGEIARENAPLSSLTSFTSLLFNAFN